ncbi:MAG: PorV/PorQ family protein [Gemmatimonadetes bacterium]|nr:PorV/PorQ family protein [Gemmatimonadota bacterium]
MRRIPWLVLALVALGGMPLGAQDVLTTDPTLPTTRTGTRGATFLSLGVGARAQALGGAYSALADDISALYWNSAGIGQIDGFAVGVTQTSLYQDLDINHTFAGVVLPVGLSRLGISVNTLSSGEMPWTNEAFPNSGYMQANGRVGDTDPLRTDFEWRSLAVGAHFARPITDRLIVGGAVKYIEEGIPEAKADFLAFDLGTIFHTGLYGITLGASLQNVGSSGRMEGKELNRRISTGGSESQVGDFVRDIDLRAGTQEVQLPTAFRFSVVADLIGDAAAIIAPNPDQSLRLVWDLNDAIDTDLQTAVGFEYGFRNLAFLRVGKRWANEAQIERDFSHGAAFGGGVTLPLGGLGKLSFDYAYTDMADLENVQVFSLQLRF